MKKFCITLILLLLCGSLFAQVPISTPAQQLQAAKVEIARLNTIIQDVKAERNQLILTIAEMNKNAIALNAGIEKTRLILQEAITNDTKVDFQTLVRDVKWNLVLKSDTTASKSNGKSSSQKQ